MRQGASSTRAHAIWQVSVAVSSGMPKIAEFFAGIGLVRKAIEPLGWECVLTGGPQFRFDPVNCR